MIHFWSFHNWLRRYNHFCPKSLPDCLELMCISAWTCSLNFRLRYPNAYPILSQMFNTQLRLNMRCCAFFFWILSSPTGFFISANGISSVVAFLSQKSSHLWLLSFTFHIQTQNTYLINATFWNIYRFRGSYKCGKEG